MWDPQITIEEVNDPIEVERHREQRARAERNWNWLRQHWPDLLPQAYGKFLAVANQEAFLGDSLEDALGWVHTHHADDPGHIVEYVRRPAGPCSYGIRS